MKKLIFLCLVGIIGFSFSDTAHAEETLLDNNLELQTDRLNKEQVDDGKTKSFAAEDRLFEAEMIQKTADAKALEEKQKQEDMSNLFLTKAAKVKELDPTQLFVANGTKQAAVKREETDATVSSPPALFPLILGLALVTVVTYFCITTEKEDKIMADNTEHINVTLLYQKNKEKMVDLRIPNNITVYRFIRELNQIFGKEKNVKKYQIKVLNKGILLDEEQKLKDFPITDGDIIEVLGE